MGEDEAFWQVCCNILEEAERTEDDGQSHKGRSGSEFAHLEG